MHKFYVWEKKQGHHVHPFKLIETDLATKYLECNKHMQEGIIVPENRVDEG